MANTPGGSFIPKRSTGQVAPVRSGRRIYVFSYVAYVIFFGTLLSVVGIFFLNQQTEKQLKSRIALVEEERVKFDNGKLQEIRDLEVRLLHAEQILAQHVAPSLIFGSLESVIVETLQLDGFEYMRETGGNAALSLKGLTDTFDVLLFQRDVIERSPLLSAANVVEVSYGATGGTVFDGSDRSGEQFETLGEATVTFTFQSENIVEAIGYTPGAAGAPPVNIPATTATTDLEETTDTPTQ